MWLEAMYASMSIAGMCGVALGVNALFPAETERFLRILRAEVRARIPVKRARPTVELALHAGVEVDMKWWDEEFAKIQRAIPGKNWYQMMDSAIESAEARTEAELRFMASRLSNLESVTDGSVTYSRGGVLPNHRTDATPPGLPSLRGAEEAGVSLGIAITRTVRAFRDDPRVRLVPRDVSVKMGHRLFGSGSWYELILATQWCNLMLEKHGTPREEECEFCEYVEATTHTSTHVKRYKTAECWDCESTKREAEEQRVRAQMISLGFANRA